MMHRKRPLETPGASASSAVPLNSLNTRPASTFYDDTPVYDKDFNEQPPATKRSAPDLSSYYGDYSSPVAQNADSWLPGYEREMHPSQFSSYSGVHSAKPPAGYDYEGYRTSALPSASQPPLGGPSRKLTCELPLPTLPDRVPNSRYGLGLDRYGHELPSPLTGEFQDIVKEMKEEIAFLKRHPEVTCRIPHALRILERECFKLDRCIDPDWLEVDINKPINLSRKILIPVNRYPAFNFIGKIIGSRGTTLHNLGKSFKCHIQLSGEGSSRDRKKETQLYNTGDERYMHYGLPLFIQVSTIARPHVAFMRVAGFLNVLHKLLIPSHDVHIAGITDGNTWFESDETFVYDPLIFDETVDEEKEAELRAGAANVALRKPYRGPRGGGGDSGRGGRGGFVPKSPNSAKDDYVVCYDPNEYDEPQPPPVEAQSTATNGNEFKQSRGGGTPTRGSTRGGGLPSRGTTRGRGRGRGAVPIRRG